MKRALIKSEIWPISDKSYKGLSQNSLKSEASILLIYYNIHIVNYEIKAHIPSSRNDIIRGVSSC
jgi:hypothetical protein